MSYLAKVGSFNIDTTKTAGQTQLITGVGFQPKIVLFWWSGSTASSDTVAGGTYNIGFGAATSSTNRFCIINMSEDGQTDADSAYSQNDTEIIRAYTDTATLDGICDFSSLDSDGFTLIVDDQFTQAYRINYLALGGDDLTNVYLNSRTTPAATGEYDTTVLGFQPDFLLIATASSTIKNIAGNSGNISIGLATSGSQGVISGRSQDAAATSNTMGYGYNAEILSIISGATTITWRETFVSFLSNGFRLNQLEGGVARYYWYIALKGGQYSVGDLTTRADGDDISETVGFQPVALLFASANRALSTQDTPTDHARLSIGAATSASERAVQAISDEDNLADSETAYANYDTAVYAHVKDDAIEALMDIKSIDASGFTAVMDDTETAGCWVTYLAIGAAASGATEITTSQANQAQASDAAEISFSSPETTIDTAQSNQAQVSDAATLTAVDVIAPAESAQDQASDAALLTVVDVITPAEAAQAQASDAAVLTVVDIIVPAESAQAQVSEAVVLTPIDVITPAEAAQAQASDAAVISIQEITIDTSEAAQVQVSEAAILTPTDVIATSEAIQVQVSDAAVVTFSVPETAIDTAEANQVQAADAPSLTIVISPTEAAQAQKSDEAYLLSQYLTSQGPLYPGAVKNVATSPYWGTVWTGTANLAADDTSYASITGAAYDQGTISHLLVGQQFGFTIPTTTTVRGYLLEIGKYFSAGSARDSIVTIYNDAIIGNNLGSTGIGWPSSIGTVGYGGSANTWGTVLTPAQVNATAFGFGMAALATANNTDAWVDFYRVTVYYDGEAGYTGIQPAPGNQAQVSEAAELSFDAGNILAVSEAAQAQVSDAAIMTAIHVYIPADANQVQASDPAILVPVYVVATPDSNQAQVSEAASLIVTDVIATAPANQAQVSDAAVMVVTDIITPAEGNQAQASDAAILTPVYVIDTAQANQAQVSDAAGISQDVYIDTVQANQAQVSDAVILTVTDIIDTAQASQAQASDAVILTVTDIIQPAEANQAQISEAAVISGTQSLGVTEANQVQVSDAANLIVTDVIAVAQANQAQVSDAANISLDIVIDTAQANQAQVSEAAILAATYLVTPEEANQVQASDAAVLIPVYVVTTSEAVQAQVSDPATITPIYVVVTAEAVQAQVSDAASILFEGPTWVIDTPESTQAQVSDPAGLGVYYVVTVADAYQAQVSNASIATVWGVVEHGERVLHQLGTRANYTPNIRANLALGVRTNAAFGSRGTIEVNERINAEVDDGD